MGPENAKVGCRGPRREAGGHCWRGCKSSYIRRWVGRRGPGHLRYIRFGKWAPVQTLLRGGAGGRGSDVCTHLVGLSSPSGPGCQGLPWGQRVQEAPGHPLDLGGESASAGQLRPCSAPPRPRPHQHLPSRGSRGGLWFSLVPGSPGVGERLGGGQCYPEFLPQLHQLPGLPGRQCSGAPGDPLASWED